MFWAPSIYHSNIKKCIHKIIKNPTPPFQKTDTMCTPKDCENTPLWTRLGENL